MNDLDPFSASQPEDTPNAFDDLIDFQHGIDPEGGPMEHHAGQIPQGDGSHPQKEDVPYHQKLGIASGPQHAFGENGVHGLENDDEADETIEVEEDYDDDDFYDLDDEYSKYDEEIDYDEYDKYYDAD